MILTKKTPSSPAAEAGSPASAAPRFRRHGAGHRAQSAPSLAGAQSQAPQPAAADHLGGTNATQVGPGVE